MARPKMIKEGTKLNLYVPLAVKRWLFTRASAEGKSMSAVVTDLAEVERARRKAA